MKLGVTDGEKLGVMLGEKLGFSVGRVDGFVLGEIDGDRVGDKDGLLEGLMEGTTVGRKLGINVGVIVGTTVGVEDGGLGLFSDPLILNDSEVTPVIFGKFSEFAEFCNAVVNTPELIELVNDAVSLVYVALGITEL